MITERKILKTAKAYGLTVKGGGANELGDMLTQLVKLIKRMGDYPLDKLNPLMVKFIPLLQNTMALHERVSPTTFRASLYNDALGLREEFIKSLRIMNKHLSKDASTYDNIASMLQDTWKVHCNQAVKGILSIKILGFSALHNNCSQILSMLNQMFNTPIDKVQPLLAKYTSLVNSTAQLHKKLYPKSMDMAKSGYKQLLKIEQDWNSYYKTYINGSDADKQHMEQIWKRMRKEKIAWVYHILKYLR